MAKRKRLNTNNSIRHRIECGRGAGIGKDYLPWITIQDVTSSSKCTRIKGWKTGRIHEILSRSALSMFYLLEWDESISDIRESYPIPLAASIAIAEKYSLKHPSNNGNPIPLTVAYNVTKIENIIIDLRGKDSNKHKICEHYWKALNTHYKIVGAEQINTVVVRNIEWIHPYKHTALAISKEETLQALTATKNIIGACHLLDENRTPGIGLQTIRTLLAKKELQVNLEEEINLKQKLQLC